MHDNCKQKLAILALLVAAPVFGQTPDITISGTTTGNVYGNSTALDGSDHGATPSGKFLLITTGGNVSGTKDAYGAYTDTPFEDATGNAVTLEGNGTVSSNVIGGRSTTGAAADNTVTISGGSVSQHVFGGYSATGAVTGNTVTISGGTVSQNVFGGYSDSDSATGNTVTISGGLVSGDVFGGRSVSDAATGNTMTISGGSVSGSVYGGYSDSDSATGNTVTISGGTVTGNVFGGRSISDAATGNTVTISGGSVSGDVFGGYCSSSCSDVFTDNTLNLKTPGLTVARLGGFEYLNFYLPTTTFTAGSTLLTVTGTADLTDGASRSSTVNVGINGASSPLQEGDQIIL
ncbi:MAG: hypothetical protein LBJ59_03685, partial [Zoogloeaceae bacterium]|nr:hypothetical protein [Zoogloeaceae bacterium]